MSHPRVSDFSEERRLRGLIAALGLAATILGLVLFMGRL